MIQKPNLNEEALNFLIQTKKWVKFLAILGFVGLGLLIILAFFIGSIFDLSSEMTGQDFPINYPTGLLTVIYLLMAVVYFFPLWFLYKFSTYLEGAFRTGEDNQLTLAFKNLKSHYQFIGILMIILLGVYALFFIFGGLAMLIA